MVRPSWETVDVETGVGSPAVSMASAFGPVAGSMPAPPGSMEGLKVPLLGPSGRLSVWVAWAAGERAAAAVVGFSASWDASTFTVAVAVAGVVALSTVPVTVEAEAGSVPAAAGSVVAGVVVETVGGGVVPVADNVDVVLPRLRKGRREP